MIGRANAFRSTYTHYGSPSGFTFVYAKAQAYLNGVRASAGIAGDAGLQGVQLGSQFSYGYLKGSIPISFKDLHINGGARTSGSLEVTVSAVCCGGTRADAEIQLDNFTYNSTRVPDQGSTLALLAMGAGGVLALRRWRAEGEGRIGNEQSGKSSG
jgi:hypothetical protein